MSDFFDELTTVDHAPSDHVATNYLAVPEPAMNSEEFDARAARDKEIAELRLPMVFESETGELLNVAQFAALGEALGRVPTPDEACEFVAEIERPIREHWAPIIEAARAKGPEAHERAYQGRPAAGGKPG